MPEAFKNAGLYVGFFGTFMLGFICTGCMHMLVNCSHELCRRLQMPSMDFSEVCYHAFDTGPIGLRKYASLARCINISINIISIEQKVLSLSATCLCSRFQLYSQLKFAIDCNFFFQENDHCIFVHYSAWFLLCIFRFCCG